jgi:hypothetical protein
MTRPKYSLVRLRPEADGLLLERVTGKVVATPEALELIERLRTKHGPLASLSVQGPRGKRGVRVVVVGGRERDP